MYPSALQASGYIHPPQQVVYLTYNLLILYTIYNVIGQIEIYKPPVCISVLPIQQWKLKMHKF